jgi:hypothetical protein
MHIAKTGQSDISSFLLAGKGGAVVSDEGQKPRVVKLLGSAEHRHGVVLQKSKIPVGEPTRNDKKSSENGAVLLCLPISPDRLKDA